MKTNSKILTLLTLLVIVYSCNNDDISDDSFIDQESFNIEKSSFIIAHYNPSTVSDAQINTNRQLVQDKEGRLVFNSQEDFNQTMKNLKTLDENALKEEFQRFYSQGFVSLHPYFEEDDEEGMASFVIKKKDVLPNKYSSDIEIDSDPLISDNLFASILNYKREVIINGKILKYTFSGLLITDVKNSDSLDEFVRLKDLYNSVPDPAELPMGLTMVTDNIFRWVNPYIIFEPMDPCLGEAMQTPSLTLIDNGGVSYNGNNNTSPSGFLWLNYGGMFGWPCGWPNNGGTPSEPEPEVNHREDMIAYSKSLEPCYAEDAGIGGIGSWTPLGTRKRCFDYFNGGKRRTRTLYSNEDYGVYKSLKVKATHQRKHSALGVRWWAQKKTDEAALMIEQASFRVNNSAFVAPMPDFSFQMPTAGESKFIYYSNGYLIKPDAVGPQIQQFSIPLNKYPSTPFDEDVIVQFFNDNISLNQSMDIASDKLNQIFWDQVWSKAKSVFSNFSNEDPTRITMITTTPNYTYVNYVEVEKRKTNTGHIDKKFFQDWGFNISINITLNGSTVITNPSTVQTSGLYTQLDPVYINDGISRNFSFSLPQLTEFDNVKMNFTGLTRRGDEWRGSKMELED